VPLDASSSSGVRVPFTLMSAPIRVFDGQRGCDEVPAARLPGSLRFHDVEVDDIGAMRGGVLGFIQGDRSTMRQQRVIASLARIAATTLGALALLPALAIALAIDLGTAPAGATTRLRSGTLHAEFASHVASTAGAGGGALSTAGADVTAIIVATLALLALAFIVVTLIRRRISPA
jgi:hypothetical protein